MLQVFFLTRCAQTVENVIRLTLCLRPADRLAPIKVSNTIAAAAASLIPRFTPLAFLCIPLLLCVTFSSKGLRQRVFFF